MPKDTAIYIDDTIQTFLYQKQALQIKLKHNIAQLSAKNAYLGTILKQLCNKESQAVREDCQVMREIIGVCRGMEDQLLGLGVLEKKSEVLRVGVEGMVARWEGNGGRQGSEGKEGKEGKDAKQGTEKSNTDRL